MQTQSTPSLKQEELLELQDLLKRIHPLNRTIVSDDMDRAADWLDEAVGQPARRYRYPTGAEYGSWIVPPSWNIREAYLSDGERKIASHQDHVLFLAPYSQPFEGWLTRSELLQHVFISNRLDDVFVYQHRFAYDFQKRLRGWEITLPRRLVETLRKDRYYVKIDVDVRPGALNVLEYTAPGREEKTVAFLSHLCHSGQSNDGLSGVIAGVWLIRRFLEKPRRFTTKLLVFPETIGSSIHVVAQQMSREKVESALFLETMGRGDRLYLKKTRTGDKPLDRAIRSLAQEQPDIGILDFYEGYGNDELVFDFANVGVPSGAVEYFPFEEYHTSRDTPELIDWGKWKRAAELASEVFRRLEEDRLIRLRFLGPPHLTRYRLYADAVFERERFKKVAKVLTLCDGQHTLLQMCEESGLPFDEVRHFFSTLEEAGLLA